MEPSPGNGLIDARLERVRRLGGQVAARMGVTDYRFTVSDMLGTGAPLGQAFTDTRTGEITLPAATVERLDDDELTATLAHELAHLIVPEPGGLRIRHRLPVRILAVLVGFVTGATVGILTMAEVAGTDRWAWVPICALLGGMDAGMVDGFWRSRLLRRVELRCDIEAAHVIGSRGVTVFRLDPTTTASWADRFLADHPPAEARIRAINEHQSRHSCRCAPAPERTKPAPERRLPSE